MKKTLVCPKCDGRVLWRIDPVRLPVQDSTSFRNSLSMTPLALPATARASWSGFQKTGQFEAFICQACGFTEWYAYGLEELEPDEKHGVQLIDNRPPEGLR